MANEGFGATSTILSGTMTGSAQTSTVLVPKGASRVFFYTQFTFGSHNLTDWRVEISDDSGTTWHIDDTPSAWRTTALSASENWRTTISLGPVPGGNNTRRVRVSATAAGASGSIIVRARFDRIPNTYYVS